MLMCRAPVEHVHALVHPLHTSRAVAQHGYSCRAQARPVLRAGPLSLLRNGQRCASEPAFEKPRCLDCSQWTHARPACRPCALGSALTGRERNRRRCCAWWGLGGRGCRDGGAAQMQHGNKFMTPYNALRAELCAVNQYMYNSGFFLFCSRGLHV
jgi:hypothetical protein